VAATHTSSSRIAIDNNGLVLAASRDTGLMTINTDTTTRSVDVTSNGDTCVSAHG
jgi:hypothetical protein